LSSDNDAGYCTETTVNETAVNGTQGPKKDDIVTTLSVSLNENITLEEAQVHVTKLWTRYFFDMPRRPRNGSVTFVFPGLFSQFTVSLIAHTSVDSLSNFVTR
jgi:hypothetical protein